MYLAVGSAIYVFLAVLLSIVVGIAAWRMLGDGRWVAAGVYSLCTASLLAALGLLSYRTVVLVRRTHRCSRPAA